MLDIDFARTWFPALQTPWALFDNAGGSVPARPVIERVAAYMSTHAVQLGASYDLSVAAGAAVEAGRGAAARLLGADVDETVLGPSATALTGRLAAALVPTWRAGDEVIVTNLDHEANVGAWRRLEAQGIVIREWRFRPETMRLELDDLEELLSDRTRLVAFTHCSNVVGTIHDVPEITARIRRAGALSCVDGVAFAPHRRVEVRALGADFYVASLYKVFGPHVGVLYGRREALLEGRNVNHFFVGDGKTTYKYEPGGVMHEAVAGLVGISDYLDAIHVYHGGNASAAASERTEHAFDLFADAEARLVAPLLEFLRSAPRVHVLGSTSSDRATRVPTVAFTVDGCHASDVPAALDLEQIAIRFGHFYAYRAVEALGLHERGGVVRASLLHYNTPSEVDRLIASLDAFLAP
ncbi:putative cysteine desulfurase [Planctomycetes bacterium Poly30]|uniref:Putative cysteine desulfurase n=1 Tax=Saltatorellus ferox TaxID=2528018 RepID=A0A518F0U7_9BACT|nr:putative cysteine desulfurase [Planctomycetes bacterium Poly30]